MGRERERTRTGCRKQQIAGNCNKFRPSQQALGTFCGHFTEVGRSPRTTHTHPNTHRTREQVKDTNWSQRQLKNVSFGFASVQFGFAAHSRVCFEFILFFLNEALPSHCQNIEIKEFSILISLARIVARQKGVRLRAKMEMETATGDGLEGGPTTASYGQRLLS